MRVFQPYLPECGSVWLVCMCVGNRSGDGGRLWNDCEFNYNYLVALYCQHDWVTRSSPCSVTWYSCMYLCLGMRGGYRGGGRLCNDCEFDYNYLVALYCRHDWVTRSSPCSVTWYNCMYAWVGMRGGYRGGGRLWNDYEFDYNSVGLPHNTRGRVSPPSLTLMFSS